MGEIDYQPVETYVATFGVDEDRHAGIPFGLLRYAHALAQSANKKTPEGTRTYLSLYANDFSRFAVQQALGLAREGKSLKGEGASELMRILRVALEDDKSDHADKDKILTSRDLVISIQARQRVRALLAAKDYLPALRDNVGEVDSLMSHIIGTQRLKGFVLDFIEAVLVSMDRPIFAAMDGLTVEGAMRALQPKNLAAGNDSEELAHGIYLPAQAAAEAGFTQEVDRIATYRGSIKIDSPRSLAGKTLEEATRNFAAEIAEIMDSDVTDSMKDDDLFLVDPAAGGISFTENNSGDCDPFYANEEASVGMRFPWFTRDLNPALTLEWWREHFGTGAEAAVESRGPREVKRRQLDPVIKDFFGGGSDEARNRLAVLLTAGCEEDEDAKRIMDWACAPNGNGEREKVISPLLYRNLLLAIVHLTSRRAQELSRASDDDVA